MSLNIGHTPIMLNESYVVKRIVIAYVALFAIQLYLAF